VGESLAKCGAEESRRVVRWVEEDVRSVSRCPAEVEARVEKWEAEEVDRVDRRDWKAERESVVWDGVGRWVEMEVGREEVRVV